jgi:TonB family protein
MSASAARGHAPSGEESRSGAWGVARPLGSAWDWPQTGLWSGVLVLLRGPAPPRGWPVGPYFPDAWIRGRSNWQLIFLSALMHVLAIVFPVRIYFREHSSSPPAVKQAEVAWAGGSKILLPYIPALRAESRKAAPHRTREPARHGADTFHPRQTIISKPKVVTHPRQTLIEPAAAPVPPKILTPLPQIVEWPNLPKPVAPRRQLRLDSRARMRQKLMRPRPQVAAPDVRAALPQITLTSEHPDIPKPALEVKTNARPTFEAEKRTDEAAPEIHATPMADLAGQKLVALSVNPAPPAPNLEVPTGNLNAQFSMSPDARKPGAAASPRASRARGGMIPGIAIVGGRSGPVSNIVGPPGLYGGGLGLGGRPPAPELPRQPGVPALPADQTRAPAQSIRERIKTLVNPEDLLEPGRVYTLHVNMPNLASVTGTWTLNFAELDENGKEIPGTLESKGIEGPEPMRKVDPKYPPAYMSARVQGDVILYAIIRRDGSVDSIEVVKSLDPLLDQNAMEALARWKFRAAEREGHAVELAAIVTIPFRATVPAY